MRHRAKKQKSKQPAPPPLSLTHSLVHGVHLQLGVLGLLLLRFALLRFALLCFAWRSSFSRPLSLSLSRSLAPTLLLTQSPVAVFLLPSLLSVFQSFSLSFFFHSFFCLSLSLSFLHPAAPSSSSPSSPSSACPHACSSLLAPPHHRPTQRTRKKQEVSERERASLWGGRKRERERERESPTTQRDNGGGGGGDAGTAAEANRTSEKVEVITTHSPKVLRKKAQDIKTLLRTAKPCPRPTLS